jgi:iron(II)-dependent oxidoreductase
MAKRKEESSIQNESVVLKPIFGVKPGVYMSVLYALAILFLIFLFLFLPGIRKYGSYVDFSSSPTGSALFVDGQYLGSSPCRVFVPAGSRRFEAKQPYFSPWSETIKVKGRIFSSLVFPRRIDLHATLEPQDFSGFLTASLEDFADWAQADTLYSTYQAPLALTKAADVFASLPKDNERDSLMYQFLYTSIRYINNEYLLKDYLNALARTVSRGGVLSPDVLLEVVSKIAQGEPSARDLIFFMSSVFGQDTGKNLISSSLFLQAEAGYTAALSNFTEAPLFRSGTMIDISGLRFYLVKGGSFIMGKPLNSGFNTALFGTRYHPHDRAVNEFFMLDREVTNAQFGAFIAENPQWGPEGKADLVRAGLVTEDYLSAFHTDKPELPVTYVSYHAAKAYCAWLQNRLPEIMRSFAVRLPLEAEWEWAARSNTDSSLFFGAGVSGAEGVGGRTAGELGLFDLSGNVMEWCENWYQPGAYIFASLPAPFDVGSERCVRGGSWAIPQDKYSPVLRGSQPPAFCTPFLGFRPVIVRSGRS